MTAERERSNYNNARYTIYARAVVARTYGGACAVAAASTTVSSRRTRIVVQDLK